VNAPKVLTGPGVRSFDVTSSPRRVWNKLPVLLRIADELEYFTKLLKAIVSCAMDPPTGGSVLGL